MHAMVLTSVEMSLIAVMISIPLWQVGDGGVLEEIRRKTEFSDYSISIVFWKSSFILPRIDAPYVNLNFTV